MDIDAVVNALRVGVATSEPLPPPSGDVPPWFVTGQISIPPDSLTAIVTVLQAQPDLAIFDDHMMQFTNFGRRVTLAELARWLVRRARAIGPDQAVFDLVRYVEEDRYPAEESCLLSGVTLTGEVEILAGIHLLPFERLPDSVYKKMFSPMYWQAPASMPTYPTAALICENQHPKHHATGAEPPIVSISTRYEELGDVRLILTLVGPSAPVILAFWSIPAPWVPMGDAGASWSSPPEQGRVTRAADLQPGDLERVRDLYGLFRRLAPDSQQHLRVPLDRLNRALRRSDLTDSAIELGIALEALFLNDLEDERGELTLRLRVRGARFLGTTVDERMEIDQLLKNVYRLRSVAVHTGTVPQRLSGAPPTGELLEKGYSLTARAIEQVIRRGGSPEWSQVTLA